MDAREAILNSAKSRMRLAGFHACSFRDIAADVGIKSASVHYHFSTKAELGAALVSRYEGKMLALLGDPEDDRALSAKLQRMRAVFRAGLTSGACLGGVLATQASGLPPEVVTATRRYFEACNLWLRRALGTDGAADTEPVALEITALLQGAMLQAVILGDVATFDAATRKLGESSG